MTFRQHQKFLSAYKKYYHIIKNTQRTNGFFCKQAFAFRAPMFLVSARAEPRKNTSVLYTTSMFVTNKVCDPKRNYKSNIIIQNFNSFTHETQINILAKRQRFISNSLKGILLVNFPEKEKNFLIKNLAAENKIALITQSASLLLKDSRNMDDLLGVDDPIQILFDRVKTCLPCICFINNLDRIGKQRYEQPHKSLYRLNPSISSLISGNFTHDRVFETTNEKEKFDLSTITLSERAEPRNKISRFKNNDKKTPQGRILKNLESRLPLIKPFSVSPLLKNNAAPHALNAEHFSFSLVKKPVSGFLFRSFLLQKDTDKKQKRCSKFLNPFKKDFTRFFKKNTRVLNNGYYHRLPFWLWTRAESQKNQCFPKYKIGISRVKLFDFFYQNKNQKKNTLTSLQLKVNPWLLQMILCQTRSSKSRSMFTKTEYNRVDLKTNLKNPPIIYSGPFFKDSLMELDSIEIFENQLKPVSKINSYYLALSKKRFDFKDLGSVTPEVPIYIGLHPIASLISFPLQHKRPGMKPQAEPHFSFSQKEKWAMLPRHQSIGSAWLEQKKMSRTSLNSSKQSSTFRASSVEQVQRGTRSLFQFIEIKKAKNNFFLPFNLSKNKKNLSRDPSFSFDMKKKRSTSVFSQNFEMGVKDKPINTKFIGLKNPAGADLFSNLEEESESTKGNSLKITETEIIKRTALLKFLQILDGFHTTTEKKKWVFFRDLAMFLPGETLKIQTKKGPFQFKTDFGSEWSKWLKKFIMPKMLLSDSAYGFNQYVRSHAGFVCFQKNKMWEAMKPLPTLKDPEKIKPKPVKLKTRDKSFLWAHTEPRTKNFFTGLILKPEKHPHNVIGNSIQNNRWFFWARAEPRKITRSQKLRETQKGNTYGATRISRPRQEESFLGYASTKKTFPYFSFIKRVPKWELYLKNQPVLKSLNLLCVWPSYTEDIVGPFNLNDGASYILPEYFQLLGHGPKLKKQGITLIASTNNLATLDAALLRPGRFDTIINFADSFSSIHKRHQIVKHAPSFTQNRVFSISARAQSRQSLIREREIVDFSTWRFRSVQNLIAKEKKKKIFVFLEKNTDFLFNNTILMPSFPLINMDKTVKNQFDPQVTLLDIPNRSIPIKTFIDVSIFIQYKLWWSFNNGKLLWLELYQTNSIQKPKTSGSDSEKFKIFKPISIIDIEMLFKSKTYIDLIRAFIAIFRMICFRAYTMFQVKFFDPKIIMKSLDRNRTKFSRETNQNSDFVNRLGWEILISKTVVDFGFSLPFDKSNGKINLNRDTFLSSLSSSRDKLLADPRFSLPFDKSKGKIDENRDASFSSDMKKKRSASIWLARSRENTDASSFLKNKNEEAQELPKNYDSLYDSLDQYYESKKQLWTLNNDKTAQRFTSNFHLKHDDMFLKSNRRLLFCIGDFDYKIDPLGDLSEKNFDFILKKTRPWEEKQHFFLANQQKQTQNITPYQATNSIKTTRDLDQRVQSRANKKKGKNAFLESKFGYSVQSIDVTTAFLDPSSKIWKDSGKAHIVKNVNLNGAMLTKYNAIYKLKKIKVKQQSFFNLHPFTRLMLKRWRKLTTPNKLKRHLKVPLASVFSGLENHETSLFLNTSAAPHAPDADICLPSLSIEEQQNFSINPSSWFLNFDLGSLYTQIYQNLYKATLLMPNLEKESTKTFETNSFFSTYQSYLFKKLTRDSSLNIMCLQVNPTFPGFQFSDSPILSSLGQRKPKGQPQTKSDLKKSINISGLENKTKKIIDESFSYKSSTWKSWIFTINLLQTEKILKKIAKRTVINQNNSDVQSTRVFSLKHGRVPFLLEQKGNACLRFKRFNTKTNQVEINNNLILLKNLVSNEKKEHNFVETDKSFLQSYKICPTESDVSLETKRWGGTQLDTSFFLLIFYTMFFEKIQQKKIILDSIKIFMPYKSLVFSHFLLSQAKTYGFSCKNLEILVYNKFKNFLVDF